MVFYDTWAYVALADRGERLAHAAAGEINRRILGQNYLAVTTNYVIDESLTLIKRRLGHHACVQFLDDLEPGIEVGMIRLEWITPDREEAARLLFRRYQDKPKLSLTDCTSFVVMAELMLRNAFTADEHFEQTDPKNMPFRCLVRARKGKYQLQSQWIR
jgi:predicted nucleic acid-binding protein